MKYFKFNCRIFTSLILISVLIISSCKKLDSIRPTNVITSEDVFSNINGPEAYLATLYRELPIEDYLFMPGTGGEYADFNNPNGNIGILFLSQITDQAIQSQWGEQSPGYVLRPDYFSVGYKTIRDINRFKDEVASSKNIDSAQKREYKAEASFMTAFVYFYLAKKFGGVPIVKDVQDYNSKNPGNLFIPRSTEEETWDYIIDQCDSTADNLPNSGGSLRRANKWAALALKSRAALYAASIAKFGHLIHLTGEAVQKGLAGIPASSANKYYKESMDASLEIMTKSDHGLYKPNPANPAEAQINYGYIFTHPNETDGEAIFIKGITGEPYGSSLNQLTEPVQTGGSGRISPALDLVDVYENYEDEPGKRSNAPIVTKANDNFDIAGFSSSAKYISVNKDAPYNLFNGEAYGDPKKAKDARMWASLILPGTEWKGVKIIIQGGLIKQDGSEVFRVDETATGKDGKTYQSLGGSPKNVSGFFGDASYSKSGFLFRKMISENDPPQNNKSTLDFIVFRYAEILLNYAEAVFESGEGDEVMADEALNAVRKRAGHTNNIPLTRENIRDERLVELSFENIRVWDLIRWRVYHTLETNYSHEILVPMLDLRSNPPQMIFIRKNTIGISLNGPANFSVDEYYEPVPRDATNPMIQNP